MSLRIFFLILMSFNALNLAFQIYEIVQGIDCIFYTIFGALSVINLFLYACLIDEEK